MSVRRWFGYGWAQPVKRRRWALAATALHSVQRATGHRLHGKYAHRSWERACGL